MTLGFIGCGKMASALAKGVLNAGVSRPEQVWASDAFFGVAEQLGRETGVNVVRSNSEVAGACETLLICVKPQDVAGVLRELRPVLDGKLVVSIAAGGSLGALEEAAGQGISVVRVMPNTRALVHKGASAYAVGACASKQDAETVRALFASVGVTAEVKEALLDAVTGLSGSGPAYAFLMIEALADGGVLMGLPRELSLKLAAQTLLGAAEMVLATGEHPGKLRDAVASPGGTTIAGIEALELSGVRAGMIQAVRRAEERSREMGRD